jgi:hypothetical protein
MTVLAIPDRRTQRVLRGCVALEPRSTFGRS